MSFSISNQSYRLAALQIESESQAYESNRQTQLTERAAKHEEEEQQAAAMRDQGSHIFQGALLSGALAGAGGSLSIASAATSVPGEATAAPSNSLPKPDSQATTAPQGAAPQPTANEGPQAALSPSTNATAAQQTTDPSPSATAAKQNTCALDGSKENQGTAAADKSAPPPSPAAKDAEKASVVAKEAPTHSRVMGAAGQMLSAGGGPAGQMLGDSRAKADEARIIGHRTRSERASERADDAGEQAHRRQKASDDSLDTLRELLRTQRETASALLSRG